MNDFSFQCWFETEANHFEIVACLFRILFSSLSFIYRFRLITGFVEIEVSYSKIVADVNVLVSVLFIEYLFQSFIKVRN